MTVGLSTRLITALLPVALAGASFAIAWSTVEVNAASAGNMKAYMDNTVMPAMQPIWDGSYADKLTDADWKSMQDNAAKLQASVPVIASGGAIPAEQARAKQAKWQEWSKKLGDEIVAAKAAAAKKDQMALAMSGDNLVEICGGCHQDYDPTAR